MSQITSTGGGGGGSGTVAFLEGNTGGAVGPNGSGIINVVGDGITINVVGDPLTDTLTISTTGLEATTFTEDTGSAQPSANNLNIVGTSAQGISTSGAGSTVTITASNAATSQKGVVALATNAEAIAGTDTAKAITADDLKAKLGTQTNHGVAFGSGTTAAVGYSAAGTAGAALLSGGASANGAYIVPTAGTGLSVTTNATTLEYALSTPVTVANGGTGATTFTTDGVIYFDGTELASTAAGTANFVLTSNGIGNFPTFQAVSASGAVTSVTGGNNITITGTSTAPIVNVSGTVDHLIQIGNASGSLSSLVNGTTGQVLQATTGTDPQFANIGVNSGLTAHGVVLAEGASAFVAVTPSATSGIPFISQGTSADPIFGTAVVAGGGTGAVTLTNHGVLLGQGTSAVVAATPSTAGVPLVSNGASADPSFTTALVVGGGTGATSFTAYAPVCGGTTTTGVLQSAASGISTSGFVLTSTGASSLPTWQATAVTGIVTLAGDAGTATGSTVNVTGGANITTAASASTVTFKVSGTTNHCVQLGNSTGSLTSLANGTTGQVLTAVTGGDPVWGAGGGGSGITTINGNSGSVTGSTVSIVDSQGTAKFTGSSTTLTHTYQDANQNIVLGDNTTGSFTSAAANIFLGDANGLPVTSASYNMGFGVNSFRNLIDGNSNVAVGATALYGLTSGSNNIALGGDPSSLHSAGSSYTGSESYNIMIGNPGVNGESNVIRIGGGDGSGSYQQNACYISGISGNTVSNTQMVTIDTTTGQLGSQAIPGSAGSAFSAYLTANQPAVTGDGTAYDIPFDAVLFDTLSDFNTGTGVFTAPVTGNYYFSTAVLLNNTTVSLATYASLALITTNNTFVLGGLNPTAVQTTTGAGFVGLFGFAFAPMSAGDTAKIQVTAGGGSLNQDVFGNGGAQFTTFMGYRVA